MGLEIFIGLFQFAVSVLRFLGDWWDRRRRSPAELLRRSLEVKEEVSGKLWTILAETNGDAIIREVRRKDSYPDLDNSLRSISPWFKVELKGTYHAGIEVFTSVQHVKIEGDVARPADDPNDPAGETVFIIGRIPYSAIEAIDWEGDEFYGFTHIYCRFRVGRRRGPYAETLLYRTEPHDLAGRKFYERLDGIQWKPKRRRLLRRWLDRRALRQMDER
jgi:hypothetical protein